MPAIAGAGATGYAGNAIKPTPSANLLVGQTRLELQGRAEPIGTVAHEYSEFAIYNSMIYSRAELMYGALRDVLGDQRFRAFLRRYYNRWALRHVDEAAMRTAAEAAYGAPLGWFFDQWVHRTGVVDYALRDVHVRREGDAWITTGTVVKEGDYWHPMPLGVRVDTGWVIVRAQPLSLSQQITVRTDREPLAVRLDPYHTTPDWYGGNDADVLLPRLSPTTAVRTFDWPFLDQSLAERYVTAFTPIAWYGRPEGAAIGVRGRSNYQGLYDRHELGVVVATRLRPAAVPANGAEAPEASSLSRVQGWLTIENPIFFGHGQPLMGMSAGAWLLDGVAKISLAQTWDRSRFLATGPRVNQTLAFTGTYPYDPAVLDGRRWSGRAATDVTWGVTRAVPDRGTALQVALSGGIASGYGNGLDPYARAEAAWRVERSARDGRFAQRARLFAGWAPQAPLERGIYLSAQSPTATFANHFWRPDGGVLSADAVPYRPLGGGGLRGYDPFVAARALGAVNLEEGVRLHRFGPAQRPLALEATAFADGGVREAKGVSGDDRLLADAGVGLSLRGRFFDRDVRLRLDLPLFVRQPLQAVGERGRDPSAAAPEAVRFRWAFSFADLW